MRISSVLRVATVAALTLSPLTLGPAAHADDSTTLTIVGTSDVSDSMLVQQVLKPGFEKAYPQYTLNYVSKGTGAAIAYAEAGTASALIVHAASLENQFVGSGYSLEPYGRAIFYGDYVLLGPAADPAGVLTNTPHDIVGAFERIATAGADGSANFVSRGGTPGTTVQEHAIWGLTTGVTTCAVSTTNGGGTSPSTTTGDCPSSISYPSWYHATGLTQGPNITAGDSCNYPSNNHNCYVFTDRGTYDYLRSTNAINDLQIVARDNSADAPGGPDLLVNSFHAYGVNPAKFDSSTAATINTAAATAFLNWVTAPAAQTAVSHYLASGGQPPFLPDAAPKVTTDPLPSSIRANQSVLLKGTLTNVVPGTPALSGRTLNVYAKSANDPSALRIGSTQTDATGAFAFRFRPNATLTYSLRLDPLTQVENATLSPSFGDLLAGTIAPVGKTVVTGNPSPPSLTAQTDRISVISRLAPLASRHRGAVRTFVATDGGGFRQVRVDYVAAGRSTFAVHVLEPRGHSYAVKVTYESTDGQFSPGTSETRTVRLP